MNTYSDKYDNLPLSIIKNFKNFQQYNNCMEELEINAGDYKYRMRNKMNKYYHQFLMLELKQYMVKRFTKSWGKMEINYTGKCYNTFWIGNENKKVKYFKRNINVNYNMIDYNFYNVSGYESEPEILYNIMPQFKSLLYKEFNNKRTDKKEQPDREPTTKEIREIWGKYGVSKSIVANLNLLSIKKTKTQYIPIKRCCKTLDYSKSVFGAYSVVNLKYYNNITKKTSNLHLKATDIWTWCDDDEKNKHTKTSWCFGGIKVDDLKTLCVKNGYNAKDVKKKQYGELAEWYVKL
jgi:hypothetical protein